MEARIQHKIIIKTRLTSYDHKKTRELEGDNIIKHERYAKQ